MDKKLFVPLFVSLVASCVFALFCISFSFDISFLAFPLSAIFVFFCFQKSFSLKKTLSFSFVPVVRKLFQYLPYVLLTSFVLRRAGKYGTPYWQDVVTVFLWCVVFFASLIALYFLNEKRVYTLCDSWQSEQKKNLPVKRKGIEKITFELVDWIDAIVQAVFMVLLIQIFVLQLYMIPSESMVPKFLIGDRVIVLKTTSGPKFPLSNVGLPCVKKYKRGDVVVFRNPHYSMDRKSEVKTVTSQLVYMLTFMLVNLNKDEMGNPKADPLVKNITGLPGEQLVMQDGTLYARTAESTKFLPVDKDKTYAAWNLNELDANTKRKVANIPLSQNQYDALLYVEELRRSFSIENAKEECVTLANKFSKMVSFRKGDSAFGSFSSSSFDSSLLVSYSLLENYDSLTQKLISSRGGATWFNSFLTDWQKTIPSDEFFKNDIYAEANYKLNLMIKICAATLIVRNAELIFSDNVSKREADAMLNQLKEEARIFEFYVRVLDQRNMPVFPKNNSDGSANYIPEDCYFMMGDNRFNSADMRHSYNATVVPLSEFDPYSATYYSYIAPQYVHKRYILGSPIFRVWPISRIGKL
ncbi:MAG: signal peptidase I [Treponema sp.]|nr:signal peptidase I [Treponema sp.]